MEVLLYNINNNYNNTFYVEYILMCNNTAII